MNPSTIIDIVKSKEGIELDRKDGYLRIRDLDRLIGIAIAETRKQTIDECINLIKLRMSECDERDDEELLIKCTCEQTIKELEALKDTQEVNRDLASSGGKSLSTGTQDSKHQTSPETQTPQETKPLSRMEDVSSKPTPKVLSFSDGKVNIGRKDKTQGEICICGHDKYEHCDGQCCQNEEDKECYVCNIGLCPCNEYKPANTPSEEIQEDMNVK